MALGYTDYPNYRLKTDSLMPYDSSYGTYAGQPVNNGAGNGGGGNSLGAIGSAAAMTGNPYAVAAGLGLKTIGTGLDVFGAYKASEREDEAEKEARAEMQRQRAFQAEDRQRKQHLEDVGMAFDYGDYTGKQEDRLMNQYLDYYRKMGY